MLGLIPPVSTVRIITAYQPGEPSRDKPYRIVRSWLESFGWPMIVVGGVPGEQYNCGHSKNQGVRDSPGDPDDVLVITDADCLCPAAQIRQAVWLALQRPGIVAMGDAIRIMEQTDMDAIETWEHAVAPSLRGELRPTDNTPQLFAIRRDAFDHLGGYDEGYVGYGFEDYDFRYRASRMWEHRSVPGAIVHLWHEPAREKVMPGEIFRANQERWVASGGAMWNP